MLSVSQGWICIDNFTCCHTEIEVADQTFYLTQSQYTDTGLTSPSADPITSGAWQGSHWSANLCHWYDSTQKNLVASEIRTLDLPFPRWTPQPLGQRGGAQKWRNQWNRFEIGVMTLSFKKAFHCTSVTALLWMSGGNLWQKNVNRYVVGNEVFRVWTWDPVPPRER